MSRGRPLENFSLTIFSILIIYWSVYDSQPLKVWPAGVGKGNIPTYFLADSPIKATIPSPCPISTAGDIHALTHQHDLRKWSQVDSSAPSSANCRPKGIDNTPSQADGKALSLLAEDLAIVNQKSLVGFQVDLYPQVIGDNLYALRRSGSYCYPATMHANIIIGRRSPPPKYSSGLPLSVDSRSASNQFGLTFSSSRAIRGHKAGRWSTPTRTGSTFSRFCGERWSGSRTGRKGDYGGAGPAMHRHDRPSAAGWGEDGVQLRCRNMLLVLEIDVEVAYFFLFFKCFGRVHLGLVGQGKSDWNK